MVAVLEQDTAAMLTQGLAVLAGRQARYQQAGAYYAGDHPLVFATEKFTRAFGSLFKAFADNLCPAVVDAVTDRLVVTGVSSEDGGEDVVKEAWGVWRANRMDQRAIEVHAAALLYGDTYVIVWPGEDGQPVIHANEPQNVAVFYDSERPGVVTWAIKCWRRDDGYWRVNLYLPDRIEKYVTDGKKAERPTKATGLLPYEVEGEPWPLPNPYGAVPVFHFANNAWVGQTGRSELADVFPLQDALNKAVTDMLVAGEFMALPQRWAVGIETQIDPATGLPKELKVGPGMILGSENEAARFGQFDAANLTHYLSEQDSFRLEIARVSRTPIHYLMPGSGDFPSGEALRTAEAPFLAKVHRRQVTFGNTWEDVLRFALAILGKDYTLSVLWEDPSPRGLKEFVEALMIKRDLGVSEDQVLRELGYSDEEIARMREEQANRPDANLGAGLLQAFEQGRD